MPTPPAQLGNSPVIPPTPELNAAISAVHSLVLKSKPDTAAHLRFEGRSRLARLLLTLPCNRIAAETLVSQTVDDLPVCATALALASASVAACDAQSGHVLHAIHAADVAMTMLGMPIALPLRELIALLEPSIVESEEEKMQEENDCRVIGEVRLKRKVELAPNLTEPCSRVEALSFSIEAFRAYFEADQPVVIEACAAKWPAVDKWRSASYLKRFYGHRTVPVEWKLEGGVMEERFFSLENVLELMTTPATNEKVYMAQHPMFDYIPALEQDVVHPAYMEVVGKQRADLTNVWMGTAGSGTKMHFDSADNLLVQVVGEKIVVLVPAKQSNLLYKSSVTSNFSPVDVEQPDLRRYPRFKDVRGRLAYLKPGDALYIPAQYWHWVKPCTASISVNFWF